MRSLMLIVNPYSGKGLSKNFLGTVVSQLGANGFAVTVYLIGKHSAEELVCEFSQNHELCVCMGGDGTISGVVSGVLRAEATIPIGYIPAGTANDFAATLGIPKEPAAAAQKIIDGRPIALDIGNFGDKNFIYIAAFGAFTDVAYSTPQTTKRSLGHFAYVLSGLAGMGAITAHRTVVELDGNVIEDEFIFGGVLNSTSIAGLVKLDPEYVDLSDGLFEVILVRQPLSLQDFLGILGSIRNRSYSGDNVQLIQAKRAKFTFDTDVAWTIDGEDGGSHKQIEIQNLHKAVRIIV